MKFLFFIRDIFKRYPALLISNVVLVVAVSITEACSLFTVGPLIDFLIHPDLRNISPLTKRVMAVISYIGLPVSLKSCLIIFITLISLVSVLRILVKFSILKTKYALSREIILGTFGDFFRANWYFFSRGKQGMLLNTFIREINVVGDAFGAMALFFSGGLELVFCLAVPLYISWQVTLISLATALIFVWPFSFIGKISYRLGRLNTSTANQIGIVIQESLGLAKVILGFGNQAKSYGHLKIAFDAHRRATIKSQTIGFAITTLYQPLGVVVLAVAFFSARKFGVSLAEITVLLLSLLRGVLTIGKLASCKHTLENFFPSYEQIEKLRNQAKQLKQESGNKQFKHFDKEIVVLEVSFAYPGQLPVLVDINMKIPKGKMVAIVGESGAGKSTLIDILMGFNKPSSGRVTFDDVDLDQFEINSYRRRIGYVPQDSVLFNMSIRDNLLWAKDDATDEQLKYACQQANADEFIKAFPKGYDAIVGDRGVCLSGGQRQRIALARAILREPEILFLDEATSSLDTHSERLIQKAVENIAKETTVIVIAHRLSTIVNADYVYVLKQGRKIEEGKYADLVKIDSHFNRMVELQLLQSGLGG